MVDYFFENYGNPNFLDFNLKDLNVDEAFLKISSIASKNFSLYHKSSFCHGCPYKRVHDIPAGQNVTLKYDTRSYWNFFFSDNGKDDYIKSPRFNESICNLEGVSMGEFGIYEIDIDENVSSCRLETLKQPVFIYSGFIIGVIFCFIFLPLVTSLFSCLRRKLFKKRNQNLTIDANIGLKGENSNATSKKVRLKSLDVFRGITICLMILVNHGGGRYWFLDHVPWNGLVPADVVFPWFMWIMGVCIPMGLLSAKKKMKKGKIFLRILERSVKLFAIGIILNSVGGHNQLETLRIPGVLQRFGFSYFFTSTLMLLIGPSPERKHKEGVLGAVDDLIVLLPQWIIYILIAIGHTMFLLYMPIPDCPTGYIGPGGMSLFQNGEPSPDCVGGITRFIDIWILGEKHIYSHPTPKHVYETSSMDPEGILGCVTTLIQVFFGIQAGQILMSFQDHNARCKRWIIWSVVTLILSLILTSGTFIDGPLPVSKNLWSLSFVLITSSLAFFFLTICYVLVDMKKVLSGTPFFQTGMNSIFLYVADFFAYNVFPWRFKIGDMKTHSVLFGEALWGTLLWTLVALYLHKKGQFYAV